MPDVSNLAAKIAYQTLVAYSLQEHLDPMHLIRFSILAWRDENCHPSRDVAANERRRAT